MDLNIHTYEAWLLDYIEGNLSRKQIEELKDFLNIHPELSVELDDYAFLPVLPQPIFLKEKEELKKFNFDEKAVSKASFDEFCIASIEHLLTPDKQAEYDQFIKTNPLFSARNELYSRTVLRPELSVIMPKSELYRHPNVRQIPWKPLSMAASVALLMAGWWWQKGTEPAAPEVIRPLLVEVPGPSMPMASKEILDKGSRVVVTSRVVAADEVPAWGKTTYTIDNEMLYAISIREDLGLPIRTVLLNSIQPQKLEVDESILENTVQPIEKLTALGKLQNWAVGLRHPKSSVISVLGAGVNGLGELTSTNLKFVAKKDSIGQISAFSFQAGSWKYYYLGSK